MDLGDYPLALSLFLKVLQQNDDNRDSPIFQNENLNESNTLNQLGNVYVHLGEPDKAVDAFERGIRIAPGNMAIRSNLGVLYRSLGKRDLARATMEEGLALCDWGEDAVTHAVLTSKITTDVRPHSNEIKRQTIELKSKVSTGKPPAALLNNLGLVELEDGNYGLALFLFEKAADFTSIDGREMKSADGDSIANTMKRNIERARDGLRLSAIP